MKVRVSALALVCVLGCQDNKNGTGPAGSVSYATVKVTAPPSSGAVATSAGKAPATVCRIISASGSMKRDAESSGDGGVSNGDVMGDSWVDLTTGAKLAIKNGTTTREMLFEGPGAVRACVNGEEEMWMPSGVFTSVVGAGETPGSEVWIVTPHAVFRYGSGARLTLTGGEGGVDAKLQSGAAWAWPTERVLMHDAGAPKVVEGWTEIPTGANVTFVSKKSPSQVLGDCEQASKAAHDLGASIVSRDASLAEAAPQHVVARQKAHAICAIAELVAARSLDPVERQRLLPRARTANAKWREL